MIILGITNAMDSGATLVRDGKIVAAANEERFTRKKLDDAFPEKSISYVLKEGNVSIKDVDAVAYGWMKGLDTGNVLVPLTKRIISEVSENPSSREIMLNRIRVELSQDLPRRQEVVDFAKKNNCLNRLHFIEHHPAHANSAFLTSPFNEALVITADARGDFKSTSVSIASQKEGIKEIDFLTTFDSLGYFYGQITGILGFTPARHEGKVTGLAAYGNPGKCIGIMKDMIDFKNGTIRARITPYYKPFFTEPLPALLDALKPFSKEDIAAACQKQLEDAMVKFAEKYVKEFRIKNICLAGGVFANVKLNQRILGIEGVENVYVHPNMGDGGLGTGAALAIAFENSERIERPMTNAYLGPGYSEDEIKTALKEGKLKFEKMNDKAGIVTDLIKKGKIVGLFNGRMEYGPRALGNRTILYHTKDKSVNDWLNKRLKRTEFMPFAPVTPVEIANKCYIGWKREHLASHFMTITYNCTDEMKKDSPAVVHVDNTARPQVIRKEDNMPYYNIVRKYCDETGSLSLINTSFNQHEEPILCTPEDAVKSLLRKNVDVLVIGDFLASTFSF